MELKACREPGRGFGSAWLC